MSGFLDTLEQANGRLPDAGAGSLILALMLAFVLGQVAAWAYARTHAGLSYSRSFTQSLVLLAMLVSLVMFVIGNSLVAAFGLLGALAIIRFRNVLKDTRDTVFIFLALVIGMACGTQRFVTAIVGTAAILGAAAMLSWSRFGSSGTFDGYLTVRVIPDSGGSTAVTGLLRTHCRSHSEISRIDSGQGVIEQVYQVGLRRRERADELLSALRGLDFVRDASLVVRDELAEA